ncbi:MAG: hypothetical protein QOF78_735 [Phycisphaerales bacterium]|jgi:hypothetical protein|nr:hypothetical protein [Phycisphaerales bacterium]
MSDELRYEPLGEGKAIISMVLDVQGMKLDDPVNGHDFVRITTFDGTTINVMDLGEQEAMKLLGALIDRMAAIGNPAAKMLQEFSEQHWPRKNPDE